jgi:hypothetical protein
MVLLILLFLNLVLFVQDLEHIKLLLVQIRDSDGRFLDVAVLRLFWDLEERNRRLGLWK